MRRPWKILRGWLWRAALGFAGLVVFLVLLYRVINPPATPYMLSQWVRLGNYRYQWVSLNHVTPALPRALVAAEDANFCRHWGFDLPAIRAAIRSGSKRGASTITQQVVKNLYLWQGRSWLRKALEAFATPVVELFWSKRRILEVYLNVAEFGTGVFGAEAAAQKFFSVSAAKLSARQAALLAAVLPDPEHRSPLRPSAALRARARAIEDGSATLRADGRARCFKS